MDFDDNIEEAAFRAQARAWIQANAPIELRDGINAAITQTLSSVHPPEIQGEDPVAISKAWQSRKAEGGWACLHWPQQFGGRGATAMQRVIWQQEEGPYAQLSNLFVVGHGMSGPTLITHGTEEQKLRYLKPIVSGEEVWCQLFSEPSGGSDLAGLRSRAQRDGDDWIINGQKIWTTHAQVADYGIMLVRTDPNLPKHAGLTMFIVDMKAPGVDVRPIRQMTGEMHFNEVFFSDVRVPDTNRIGAVGAGWKVGLTTLANERLQLAAAIPTGVSEVFELCCDLHTTRGRAVDDPSVRPRLATWLARQRGLQWTMMRTISALSGGKPPGPENGIGKLVAGEIAQDICAFALELQGAAGVILDEHGAERSFQKMLLSSASIRVGGGTAEIQKNILAEQVLGLPADPRADKGMAFNEIPSGRA